MDRAPLDPYATLGIGRAASPAQVARAYHRLAKELHPDLRGDGSGERMRDVNAAWEILSDPAKRAAWDRGQEVVAAGAHWTRVATPAPMRSARGRRWAEWPAERSARPADSYPTRPRPGERRRSDSPWLVAAVGTAIIAATLLAAGLFSLNSPQTLADRFEGFRAQEGFPALNRTVAGTAIRITFGVGGFAGHDLLADGSPTSRDYPCENGATGPPDIQTPVGASGPAFAYVPASHAYAYIWKTDASWAGTCRELTFRFRDGSSKSALFDFRAAAT